MKVSVWIASSNAWRSRYWRHSGLVTWRYTASTMLFAVSDSAVEKNPRFHRISRRSVSLSTWADFHCSTSFCIETSSGTQLLATPSL